jgi:hypothetical protein
MLKVVFFLGFTVMFLSECKIACVLVSKLLGFMYLSYGVGKLLICFGTIYI